ncbi:MAG TPA: hypothetical protein VME47_08870 [Acetobacteraceae bacterium]|nr:hypothetical protein [Acetobacteraceae bacterium]
MTNQQHRLSEPDDDDTVRLVPPTAVPQPARPAPWLSSRRAWLAGAGILGTACLLRGVSVLLESPKPAQVASVPVVPRATQPGAPTAQPSPVTGTPGFAIRTATEQQILHNVPAGMTVFRFADDSRILVLDFASLYEQGMTLNRVAALIEKAGAPRNRVLTNDELLAAIRADGSTVSNYYYGHDYSAVSLRRFFALADAEKIPLGADEDRLRHLLDQVGWFAPSTQGGLISIPAVGSDPNVTLSARYAILHHELSHGLFFSDPDYAGFVHDYWNTALSGDERSGVRKFLGSEGYDTTYEELMYNEMQAYLMFTRDPEFFAPARVGMTTQRLADLQTQFLRGMPTGWLRDALAATPVMVSAPLPKDHARHGKEILRAG